MCEPEPKAKTPENEPTPEPACPQAETEHAVQALQDPPNGQTDLSADWQEKLMESSISRGRIGPKVLQWEIRFPRLYLLVVVLNMLDLMVTKIAIDQKGLDEANVLAKSVLVTFGFSGFILYKFVLTGLVIMLTEMISRRKPRWAFKLIVFGCIAMGLVVLWGVLHVTVVTAFPT